MNLRFQVVREDFITVISEEGVISYDRAFEAVQTAAQEMGLVLVYTIDPTGITIISQMQLEPFKEQINLLKSRQEVNQELLDKLFTIANTIPFYSCRYLKIIGE